MAEERVAVLIDQILHRCRGAVELAALGVQHAEQQARLLVAGIERENGLVFADGVVVASLRREDIGEHQPALGVVGIDLHRRLRLVECVAQSALADVDSRQPLVQHCRIGIGFDRFLELRCGLFLVALVHRQCAGEEVRQCLRLRRLRLLTRLRGAQLHHLRRSARLGHPMEHRATGQRHRGRPDEQETLQKERHNGRFE